MKPEQGEEALTILRSRDGQLTVAALSNGRASKILNIAWGRDDGADFDHITTNISPSTDGLPIDFFHTFEIVSLKDENGGVLFGA